MSIDRLTNTNVSLSILENRRHERQAYYTYSEVSIAAGGFRDIYFFPDGTDLHIRGAALSPGGTDLRGYLEKCTDFDPLTHLGSGDKETMFLFYNYVDVTEVIKSAAYGAVLGSPTFEERENVPAYTGQLQAGGGSIVSEFNIPRNALYRARVQNADNAAAVIYVRYDIYPVPRDENLDQYFEKYGDV